MKIELDRKKLTMFFATLIEKNIGCEECPFYDECERQDDDFACAEFFIEQLTKED